LGSIFHHTWTIFLAAKSDTFHAFKKLVKILENENSSKVVSLRIDHDEKFQNEKFEHFCEKHGIKHNFPPPKTPQQNRVIKRKNKLVKEHTRTMLNETSLPR